LSEENDIDIESLRNSRSGNIHEMLSNGIYWSLHLHWPKTQAEVTECHAVKRSYTGLHTSTIQPATPLLSGYVVSFTYFVDGRRYEGILDSPGEVEKHDTFDIRYNPLNPEQNNSNGSNNSLTTIYCFVLGALMILALLGHFISDLISRL
jgi:hypothetical protein